MPNMSKRDLIATLRKEYTPETSSESKPSSGVSIEEILGTSANTVEGIVFGVLKKSGPVTRTMLVELTGLPRTTLYDALIRLRLKGYVQKYAEERNRRGRPKVYYQLSV